MDLSETVKAAREIARNDMEQTAVDMAVLTIVRRPYGEGYDGPAFLDSLWCICTFGLAAHQQVVKNWGK